MTRRRRGYRRVYSRKDNIYRKNVSISHVRLSGNVRKCALSCVRGSFCPILVGIQRHTIGDVEREYRNGWLIKTVTKSFAVYAATATEKQEWMAHITKCIEDLLRKSGKKPVEVHAAVWVPDNEATICMHCNKTQFTVLNRRHHCRQCGAVVCGPCSNKKLLLPGQGNGKAVRVCLQCYDAASKVKARPASTMDSSNNKDAQRNSADSSGGDSSGDEEEGNKEENHDEAKFYSTLGR